MFLGHFAMAYGAKRLAPRTSLGTLFAAAQLPDLVWPVLLLAGVEHATIVPGETAFTPLRFDSYPISHSLLTVAAGGALFGALHYWRRRRPLDALVLALLLFLIYGANALGPPPPSLAAIGAAGVLGGLLFLALAAWVDHHREPLLERGGAARSA